MVDLRQSPAYAEYIKRLGWKVERQGGVNVFIRPLWIFGAIAKIQRAKLPIMIKKIPGVWMMKLEPVNEGVIPPGFRRDNSPLLATKTVRVDLTPNEEKILAGFDKDCRYCIRKAEEKKIIKKVNDFEEFYSIWKQSAKRKGLWIPGKKHYWDLIECFGKDAYCLTINDQAGAVILIWDRTAYYYYAGANKEGVKANLPYIVVWEAMKEAKRRKCKVWDWEGVYDQRWPNNKWKGFSRFKKSFGGGEVGFPGCYTKWG